MTKLIALDFGVFHGIGPLGNNVGSGIDIFSTFISSAVGLMTLIAIIWFVFSFITGAIGIITSGGDKNGLESAKKKITTGIVGLVVTILAIFIIRLIGFLLGIDILNIGSLFSKIQL